VTYDTSDTRALRGHLYAITGYSELFLADLYCSGVPLSTTDFNGDFTYHAGSTTDQLYQAAIAQFDTALTLSGDGARFLNLARVGRGRAYLARAKYDSAVAAVASVPTDYSYQVPVEWVPSPLRAPGGILGARGGTGIGTVADTQGTTGLPYRSSGDPRTLSESWGNNEYGYPQYAPVKYGGETLGDHASVVKPITVASGIEARLIEAEAALQAGSGQWLTILNALRTGGSVTQVADTIADTLGITGCGPDVAYWCTSDGVTSGTFVVPPGYTLAPELGFTIQPVGAELSSACYNYSYYTSCWSADGSTEVLVYVRPAGVASLPGTGGVSGLGPLTDPGTTAGRVALLFQERAYWLFLTGQRQGDLRRLIRNYGRSRETVYPIGRYPFFLGLDQYGTDVTVPVPSAERANPLFAGCLSRGA
jgi:hypothetical protein